MTPRAFLDAPIDIASSIGGARTILYWCLLQGFALATKHPLSRGVLWNQSQRSDGMSE
jgi:hypothetical protein